MHINKHLLKKFKYLPKMFFSSEEQGKRAILKPKKSSTKTHSQRLNELFTGHLKEIKPFIPKKYLLLKRKVTTDGLYLICPNVAKSIATHVLPGLDLSGEQIICETNAGLGLIATELLESNVKLVRLYESCIDFRLGLKDFGNVYPGRVELFSKDIFNLERYSYMDKLDNLNRVETLLKNVPKRSWSSEPVMTIVGTMATLTFLKYLIRSLALQKDIATHGRIQLFALMKPRMYGVLSADPTQNLSVYQSWTILFNLIFDFELLDKYPRNIFLPWESSNKSDKRFYPAHLDPDKIYLVKINFKKDLPVPIDELLQLYYFAIQFYGRGNNRVIPTIEKWVPGCGLSILLPKLEHEEYYDDVDIFTKFREMTPKQILSVFKEMAHNSTYSGSPFMALIENEMLKFETIETSLADSTPLEKNIAEDLEEKLDIK